MPMAEQSWWDKKQWDKEWWDKKKMPRQKPKSSVAGYIEHQTGRLLS